MEQRAENETWCGVQVGVDKNNPDHVLVKIDPQYFR
jgi:hypothetical protein